MEKFDRTEFDEVRPNRDERPFRARIGPEAQSQRFAWGKQSPLKTQLFPRRLGRLSVFATGMMAEGMGLASNLLHLLNYCFQIISRPSRQHGPIRNDCCAARIDRDRDAAPAFQSRRETSF